jgi:hypothetical protein
MTTPVSAELWIGGELVADGSAPDDGSPAALSGLQLVWGRTSTVDQPDAGTASFQLYDPSGNQTFARLAAVGQQVQVRSTGTSWNAEQAETITDPGWLSFTAGTRVGAGAPSGTPQAPNRVWCQSYCDAYTVTRPGGGVAVTAVVKPTMPQYNGANRVLVIPPLPLAPPTDPTAWDGVPRTAPGQAWTIRVGAGWAAPGTVLWVAPAYFTTPWAWPTFGPQVAWDPAGGPLVLPVAPTMMGRWMGLGVISSPGYTWDRLPPTLTWDTVDPTWTWDTMGGFWVDDTSLTGPSGSSVRTVLAFSGRITDATAGWVESVGAAVVNVTATDSAADLANRDVGAEPWPAETVAARASRIVAASGYPVTLVVDPGPGARQVTRMDVDRQQVLGMLQDVATSVDAVLWAAAHSTLGPYLWVEDMTTRPAVNTLALVGGVITVVHGGTAAGLVFSACELDLEPVRWVQTLADLATRVVVTWRDQTTTPDPTDRTVLLRDADMEAPTGPYGTRRVSVTSQVTTEAVATEVAAAVLSRLSSSTGWRVGGLVWHADPDMGTAEVDRCLTLLDGTLRLGAPLTVTDLPGWSPSAGKDVVAYVEGGSYTYTDGAWTLDLVAASANGVGASVTWDQLDPTWTWDQWDPTLTWDDLRGVGPPAALAARTRRPDRQETQR